MAAAIPCSSEDGNQAVVIISSLIPGMDMPTQSLCLECLPPFLVAMLAQFTGIDVTEHLYAAAEQAAVQAAEATHDAEATDPETTQVSPPPKRSGRSRPTSSAPPTDDVDEDEDDTDEAAAASEPT